MHKSLIVYECTDELTCHRIINAVVKTNNKLIPGEYYYHMERSSFHPGKYWIEISSNDTFDWQDSNLSLAIGKMLPPPTFKENFYEAD